MNITDIEVSIVREAQSPTRGDSPLGGVKDNRQQAALITVRTDAGLAGYGEANANPAAIKALIESEYTLLGGWDDGIKDLLVGEDPSDPRTLWTKLVGSTFWSCKNWARTRCPGWDRHGSLGPSARSAAFRYGNSSAPAATRSSARTLRSTTDRAGSTTTTLGKVPPPSHESRLTYDYGLPKTKD